MMNSKEHRSRMLTATRFQKSFHLPESGLLPASEKCPLCSSTNRVKSGVIQTDPDVHILTCRHCRGSSVDRMPTDESLANYYGNYYEAEKGANVTIDLPGKLAAHIARRYTSGRSRDTLKILDFGGGDGTIAQELAKRLLGPANGSIDICVVDFHARNSETGNNRIRMECLTDLNDLGDDKYDIVIASAIIEHIPAPAHALITLLNSMALGGIFYARTPYILPLMKLLKRFGLKIDFTFPGHVHDMGQSFWEGLLDWLPVEGKFKVVRSRPSIVETTFSEQPARTIAAHILKAPSLVIRNGYGLVGGWEIFFERTC